MKLDEEQNRNLIQLLTFRLTFIVGLSRATGFTLSKLWRLEKTSQHIQME